MAPIGGQTADVNQASSKIVNVSIDLMPEEIISAVKRNDESQESHRKKVTLKKNEVIKQ